MSRYYVYPKLFGWDQIVPNDYPFIHIKGPEGTKGVLLAFNTQEAYDAFSGDDGFQPIIMEEADGKKQD